MQLLFNNTIITKQVIFTVLIKYIFSLNKIIQIFSIAALGNFSEVKGLVHK